MADLDTAAKRKSAIGVGLHWLRMGIIPDGSDLSAPQRLHVQALYAGIASLSPSGIAYFDGLTTSMTLTGVGR